MTQRNDVLLGVGLDVTQSVRDITQLAQLFAKLLTGSKDIQKELEKAFQKPIADAKQLKDLVKNIEQGTIENRLRQAGVTGRDTSRRGTAASLEARDFENQKRNAREILKYKREQAQIEDLLARKRKDLSKSDQLRLDIYKLTNKAQEVELRNSDRMDKNARARAEIERIRATLKENGNKLSREELVSLQKSLDANIKLRDQTRLRTRDLEAQEQRWQRLVQLEDQLVKATRNERETRKALLVQFQKNYDEKEKGWRRIGRAITHAVKETEKLNKANEQTIDSQRRLNQATEEGRKRNSASLRLDNLLEDGGQSLLKTQVVLSAHYKLITGIYNAYNYLRGFIVELDKEMFHLQAITRTTNAEMEGLKQRLVEVSENTKFTALEVTKAATILGQAGFSATEIKESIDANYPARNSNWF